MVPESEAVWGSTRLIRTQVLAKLTSNRVPLMKNLKFEDIRFMNPKVLYTLQLVERMWQ